MGLFERCNWVSQWIANREARKAERRAKRDRMIEECPEGHGIIYVGAPRGPTCGRCGEPRERHPTLAEMENF
jgi:hypothetical protein